MGGVADADQAGRLLMRVAIPRRELLAVAVEQPEVDLIGAVGVGGVALRLDVGRIVVQVSRCA